MFAVYKDFESTTETDSPQRTMKYQDLKKYTVITRGSLKKLHRRSLSADTLKSLKTENVELNLPRSTPSSPTKRQYSVLDTPQNHSANKENWDPVLKLYSTDRQKKYRSLSTCSIFNERVPLQDITFTFQSRLSEARKEPLPGAQNQPEKAKLSVKAASVKMANVKLGDKTNAPKTTAKKPTVVAKPKPVTKPVTKPLALEGNENSEPKDTKDLKNEKPSSVLMFNKIPRPVPKKKSSSKRSGILMMR